MKRPRCAFCRKAIPTERVYAARSRGKEPKYCSATCKGNAITAAYRARKRQSQPPP